MFEELLCCDRMRAFILDVSRRYVYTLIDDGKLELVQGIAPVRIRAAFVREMVYDRGSGERC